ncbi:MAG: hypothetical protein H6828_13590 [Planctomycetes bacterium]|nr:hypothetical protein [Planctomycetota bacterium]
MAILIRPAAWPRAARRTVLALLALSASGCLVMEQFGWFDGPRGFSHVIHVEGEELYCIDCHLGYLDGDDPGMPKAAACNLCHEDLDAEKAPEDRVEALFVDGVFTAVNANHLDPEVKFSHLKHVSDDEEGCRACHSDVIESDVVRPWMKVDMDACVACHETESKPTSCETCHNELSTESAPKSHAGNWERFHGQSVRARSTATADRCDLCHEESTCASCHQEQPPQSHDTFWRHKAHGLMARMDRENCTACHRADYCDRCHQDAQPRSHGALWGSPRNTHCYGCHESEAQQSCYVCHQSGALSHALAPAKPFGHDPASDCSSCHVVLPHVDNGLDCNSCHF